MISVVIPALNEGRVLRDCLASLRNQDYDGEYEIVVADNGSTDDTAGIAMEFHAEVVSCPEKKSVFYARQIGADAARGDIIAQADADTVYPRDWLKRIADRFTSRPEVKAVAGRFVYGNSPWWAKFEYLGRHIVNSLSTALSGIPLVASGATLAFRRQAFLSVNGYRGISYSPDQYGISSRLSKLGRVLYDKNLCVSTSSRAVQKPILRLIADLLAHVIRWEIYFCMSRLRVTKEITDRTPRRRVVARLLPVLVLVPIISLFGYGYFIPTSPVFGKVYYSGATQEKAVALTFDDGPNEPYTSQVLDILASYNIKTTFFLIGKNVERYPETAKRIVAEGHVIGNHSYSHNANHALIPDSYKDVELAQVAIFNIVGVMPHLYRPPHGKKSPWELENIRKLGLIEVTWTVSTKELEAKSAMSMAEQIVNRTDPGEIILLHDGYGTSHNSAKSDKSLTVRALPVIIEQLQAKGYKFVTVPQLLGVAAYNHESWMNRRVFNLRERGNEEEKRGTKSKT